MIKLFKAAARQAWRTIVRLITVVITILTVTAYGLALITMINVWLLASVFSTRQRRALHRVVRYIDRVMPLIETRDLRRSRARAARRYAANVRKALQSELSRSVATRPVGTRAPDKANRFRGAPAGASQ